MIICHDSIEHRMLPDCPCYEHILDNKLQGRIQVALAAGRLAEEAILVHVDAARQRVGTTAVAPQGSLIAGQSRCGCSSRTTPTSPNWSHSQVQSSMEACTALQVAHMLHCSALCACCGRRRGETAATVCTRCSALPNPPSLQLLMAMLCDCENI